MGESLYLLGDTTYRDLIETMEYMVRTLPLYVKEFKEYTGITIYQYLLIRRVLMAQEMIQQGMKPKEAALHCGFQDYTSFYRAFKTRAGVSPEQYRKMIGK